MQLNVGGPAAMLTPSRLVIARKRRSLTLTRLAQLTGLSTRSISLYENGHQQPSDETLLQLAEVLDVSSAFLGAPGSDAGARHVTPAWGMGRHRIRLRSPGVSSTTARFTRGFAPSVSQILVSCRALLGREGMWPRLCSRSCHETFSCLSGGSSLSDDLPARRQPWAAVIGYEGWPGPEVRGSPAARHRRR